MPTDMPGVAFRHEFVLLFDVTNGNPNGDPDANNMPRIDPETGHGLVSDVALKRKVRNYVAMARPDAPGHEIYVRDGATLNNEHKRAWAAIMPETTNEEEFRKLPRDEAKARELTRWMCANFWDIRAFGAVMTTGVNAGQVRGPVQMTFAQSVEPILPQEIAITRMAVTADTDGAAKGGRAMGRKHIVPYGLYRAHGFISAPFASHPVKGSGFSNADLELLFEALCNMFDHDRTASRGEMTTRKLCVFRHSSALGNAQAHSLFERVKVYRVSNGQRYGLGDSRLDNSPPTRSFSDYAIVINHAKLPAGVEIIERC